MNPLERAVIEAARRFVQADRDAEVPPAGTHELRVHEAIEALEKYERSQEPRVLTVPWRQVVAGDELKSVKTGRFYPVTATQALARGQVRLTISLPGHTLRRDQEITRPTKEEPEATVRRGPDGQAVDVFVNVFSSGGQ